jgi:hypothetical protein
VLFPERKLLGHVYVARRWCRLAPGSAIRLLRASGSRVARAAIAVAVVVGAVKVIQIHLPGSVAEITDPWLALKLAVTLGLSERLHNRSGNSLARRAPTQINQTAAAARRGKPCGEQLLTQLSESSQLRRE